MKRKELNPEEELQVHGIDALEQELCTFDLANAPKGTTITAQELYVLERGGYELCNIVVGNIVYSMGLKGIFRTLQKALKRGEMTDFTRMNKDAREIARNRMLEEARKLGADSVIEVSITTSEYADFIEITVIGTAVKKVRSASDLPIAVSS